MSHDGIQPKDELRKAKPPKGQSLIEFALLLPILVLIIFGVLELGRAFFAFIAISNAAREGARVYSFRPDVTTIGDVYDAVTFELGTSPLVSVGKIGSIQILCGSTYGTGYTVVKDSTTKINCPKYEPVRVTVTYNHDLIFRLFFPATLTLRRSAEMMVP